uniref:Uncharacterized protein n=1 Tax=Angiostrongylus cantonensis TaxID=6313 RepID=A0A158P8A0_ANGCA
MPNVVRTNAHGIAFAEMTKVSNRCRQSPIADALQPYFPKKRKTFVCGKILDVATIPHRIARWHSLRSQLGRYLIAFEPLTFVLD